MNLHLRADLMLACAPGLRHPMTLKAQNPTPKSSSSHMFQPSPPHPFTKADWTALPPSPRASFSAAPSQARETRSQVEDIQPGLRRLLEGAGGWRKVNSGPGEVCWKIPQRAESFLFFWVGPCFKTLVAPRESEVGAPGK